MKTTDKVLSGIVVGIMLLLVVAFVVTLRQPEPTYQAEDRPEGVAHNYLLALQREDYERAYAYLSPTLTGYPISATHFDWQYQRYGFERNQVVTSAAETRMVSDEQAIVTVREIRFEGGDLFGSNQYTYSFTMELVLERDEWKILSSTRYFVRCWQEVTGCD